MLRLVMGKGVLFGVAWVGRGGRGYRCMYVCARESAKIDVICICLNKTTGAHYWQLQSCSVERRTRVFGCMGGVGRISRPVGIRGVVKRDEGCTGIDWWM